jgi:predicted transposase YbfD/YdcC
LGKVKENWLRQFLELPNGIPSHDTFGRVFAALDAEAFQTGFTRWVEAVFHVTRGQVIAIAGKTCRRSHDKGIGKEAIHMVSAWAQHNGLVLGQRKVDDKSNEITAIPELLKLLNMTGCIVTIDAMGCQKKIVQSIRDNHADYVICVKDNQGNLHQDIEEWFQYADQVNFKDMNHSHDRTVNKGHGHIEIRDCWVVSDPLAFEYIRHHEGWTDLTSIARVVRQRHIGDKETTETTYYISSLPNKADLLLTCSRAHWSVENSLHWVLDVTFREDESRVRVGNAPQNFAILRHLAINILKIPGSSEIGGKGVAEAELT